MGRFICRIEGSSLVVQSLSTIPIFINNKAFFVNNKHFIFLVPQNHIISQIQAK
jgi:hypothetical protein